MAATELANCSNLPSAEKLNCLLSPSIELVTISSFCLLHFSFFLPSVKASPSQYFPHEADLWMSVGLWWRLGETQCILPNITLVYSGHMSDIKELIGFLHWFCSVLPCIWIWLYHSRRSKKKDIIQRLQILTWQNYYGWLCEMYVCGNPESLNEKENWNWCLVQFSLFMLSDYWLPWKQKLMAWIAKSSDT